MNNEQKHSPEPWDCRQTGPGEYVVYNVEHGTGIRIALLYGDAHKANARRIVAAVNACAGIETKMLGIPNLLQSLVAARTNELKTENADLTKINADLTKMFVRFLEKTDVLKQIRHLDIKYKMEHGTFFLPEEIRAKIAAILLGCE